MLNSETLNYISRPDYDGLVRFLIEPLLDAPELLSFDCENVSSTKKVWIRLAFEDNDKGKIYGRGGRNIQAVRNVLQTAAQMAGQILYLEIYEDKERSRMKRSRSNFSKPQTSKDSGDNFDRHPRRRRPMTKPQFE
jgi:uncharacterized protein